jgi:hypothetical protein
LQQVNFLYLMANSRFSLVRCRNHGRLIVINVAA